MAFTVLQGKDDLIKVILKIDDALVEVSDDMYRQYLETLDESLLNFSEGKQPTRFVLKKTLSYEQSKQIKNEQIKLSKNGEVDVRMGFILEEVRLSLVDIENPPGLTKENGALVYVRESNGGASKDKVMKFLIGAGVVEDLYTALTNSKQNKNEASLKKKL